MSIHQSTPVKLCIVSPVFNEEEMLPVFINEINKLRASSSEDIRLLLVDDGSKDQTWEVLADFARQFPWVAGARLSRNFGHQAALTCGYSLAEGDAVVSMDSDLQDPPEVIPEMLKEFKSGADIVLGVRNNRESDTPFKRTTANLFYLLMEKFSGINAPRNAGDFRLLSRKALEALNKMPEEHRYLRGMVGWLGFKTATVSYTRTARHAGETKFTFQRMFSFAMDSLVSFSSAPLRSFYVLSLLLFGLLFAYLTYAVAAILLGHHVETGWLSLISAIIIVGATNLLCMGVMGEYLGRIYMATKHRPIYIVDTLLNAETPNK